MYSTFCIACSTTCFFFSSRRRHTRLQGDWNSDVCSSDLTTVSDPEQAVDIHVADSLSGLEVPEVRAARWIADIGSGAGFPGLALAVALPSARVDMRSEERRVGEEGRSRWAPDHLKKKKRE